MYGGRGCIHGDTAIDTPTGKIKVKDFNGGFIYGYTGSRLDVLWAAAPVKYAPEPLYSVLLSNGKKITVTAQHKFLTDAGWKSVIDLKSSSASFYFCSPPKFEPSRLPTILDTYLSEFDGDARHCLALLLNYLYGYFSDYRQCDAQLLPDSSTYRDVLQLLAGESLHSRRVSLSADDRELVYINSLSSLLCRLSNQFSLLVLAEKNCEGLGSCNDEIFFEFFSCCNSLCQQSLSSKNLFSLIQALAKLLLSFYNRISQCQSRKTILRIFDAAFLDSPFLDAPDYVCNPGHYIEKVHVMSIDFHSFDCFYDFFVPVYNNYSAAGLIHHNSGKSIGVADFLLVRGYNERHRILCTREIQNSISQSVHKLLCERIEALGLSSFYRITEKEIVGKNGTEFFFRGLYQNEESIKSIQGVSICWVEEAQSISRKSMSILLPTIREEGSIFVFTLNPTNVDDCVYNDFVVADRDNALKIEINYTDNPFFPKELRDEMEYDRSRDLDKFRHVWQGSPILHSDAQVMKGIWRIQDFTAPEKTHFYFGVDWGFSQDPTVGVRCFIMGNQLFIDYEAQGLGVETINTPGLLQRLPGIATAVSYADNARPETISHCRSHGLPNMRPCDKWKGSVEDGIQHVRGYEVIIHPRCRGVISEFQNYQYEIDRLSGQTTNRLKSGSDHFIDALRYSLNDVIRRKQGTVNRAVGW